ncbi:MAG: NAD-dependent epimerase/dehydratase family protein [Balneolaceae bacterium]
MKAFVTGATGFIGSHLADALLADKSYSEVKCLVRSREKWLEGKPYTRVDGDLHAIQEIQQALADVDVIFHLAGLVMAKTQKEFDHANVDATEHLIRLAEKSGVKNVVILSSLAAAGPSGERPRNENDPMEPVSMYGRSKMKMEKMIHNIAPDGMSIKILRPPAVYGPREDQIFTLFKMMSKGVAPIVGSGEHPRLSMVYVDDVIQGIYKASALETPGVHTYFISGKPDTCWNEIKTITETVLGKKSLAIKIKPAWVKKIAAAIETTATLFGTYPVVNREKANEMVLEWTCAIDKAQKELCFEPEYSLEEGVSRTLRWYKQNDWL